MSNIKWKSMFIHQLKQLYNAISLIDYSENFNYQNRVIMNLKIIKDLFLYKS